VVRKRKHLRLLPHPLLLPHLHLLLMHRHLLLLPLRTHLPPSNWPQSKKPPEGGFFFGTPELRFPQSRRRSPKGI
jgi:hypothetical protein